MLQERDKPIRVEPAGDSYGLPFHGSVAGTFPLPPYLLLDVGGEPCGPLADRPVGPRRPGQVGPLRRRDFYRTPATVAVCGRREPQGTRHDQVDELLPVDGGIGVRIAVHPPKADQRQRAQQEPPGAGVGQRPSRRSGTGYAGKIQFLPQQAGVGRFLPVHHGDAMERHVVGDGDDAPHHRPNLLHRVGRDGDGHGVVSNGPPQRHCAIRRGVPTGQPVIQGQRRPVGVAIAVQPDNDPALAPFQQRLHQHQLAVGWMPGQIVDDRRLCAMRPMVRQCLCRQRRQFVPGVVTLPVQQLPVFAVQRGQIQAGCGDGGRSLNVLKSGPLLPLAEGAGQFGVQPATPGRRQAKAG